MSFHFTLENELYVKKKKKGKKRTVLTVENASSHLTHFKNQSESGPVMSSSQTCAPLSIPCHWMLFGCTFWSFSFLTEMMFHQKIGWHRRIAI